MGVSDSGSRATGVRENSEQLPGKGFMEITGVWHHGATSRWIGRTHTFQFPLLPHMHPDPKYFRFELATILPDAGAAGWPALGSIALEWIYVEYPVK